MPLGSSSEAPVISPGPSEERKSFRGLFEDGIQSETYPAHCAGANILCFSGSTRGFLGSLSTTQTNGECWHDSFKAQTLTFGALRMFVKNRLARSRHWFVASHEVGTGFSRRSYVLSSRA